MLRRNPDHSPNRVLAGLVEVGLIFVGITLAIGFENWNSERAERRDEREILLELREDLHLNLDELRKGLRYNETTVARIDSVLTHIEGRLPYSQELSSSLAYLENWASPYLSRSAYETLMARGVTLISEAELRSSVVRLYENVYQDLVSDGDRTEWVNYEVSMVPLMLRFVEERPGNIGKPIDYEAMVADPVFRAALWRTKAIRLGTIQSTQEAITSTEAVVVLVDRATGAT
jgi:hypothetical protein